MDTYLDFNHLLKIFLHNEIRFDRDFIEYMIK